MKVPNSQAQGCDVYAEKKPTTANRDPAMVYAHNNVFLMGILSAITPRIGLEIATTKVETAKPTLQDELPVKFIPHRTASSPSAF